MGDAKANYCLKNASNVALYLQTYPAETTSLPAIAPGATSGQQRSNVLTLHLSAEPSSPFVWSGIVVPKVSLKCGATATASKGSGGWTVTGAGAVGGGPIVPPKAPKKKAFPLWAIILIVVLALLLVGGVSFALLRGGGKKGRR